MIGTYGGGISKYNGKTGKLELFLDHEEFLSGCIYDFASDLQGNVWIASLGGLYRYTPSSKDLQFYNAPKSDLNSNQVYSILIDTKNRLWVGTTLGFAVYALKNNQLTLLKKNFDVPTSRVMDFYEDHSGNIWVGMERNGLVKLSSDMNQLRYLTEENGLPNNSVTAVLEESDGVFWITTLKGLARLDENKQTIYSYSLSDGLPGLAFNPGAIIKDQQGQIWLGNEKGLVHFYPSTISQPIIEKNIQLTDFYLFGRPVEPGKDAPIQKQVFHTDQIQLKGNQNSIGFRFVALNYFNPVDNQYACRLTGKEEEWTILSHTNSVFYDHLVPGKYQFQVCTLDGMGHPQLSNRAQIGIQISPLFYQSWVFRFFAIGILIVLVYLVYYFWHQLKLTAAQLSGITIKPAREKYEASRLSADQSQDLVKQVVEYVEKNKPYLNPDLKINDLASEINQSAHSISQVINQYLGQSFTEFINKYRVEEVKRRMVDDEYSKFTLMAIAENCGFNSKTSFYRIFKKVTGQTPAEYLKSQTGK